MKLKNLLLIASKVTDLSPLSQLFLLKEINLNNARVNDISSLAQCMIQKFCICRNDAIKDLLCLSALISRSSTSVAYPLSRTSLSLRRDSQS